MTDIFDDPDRQPIELRPKDDVPFRLIINRDFDASCAHSVRLVDDNKRSVTCRDCGTVLDTFEVLSRIAHECERWTLALTHKRTEVRALAARLETLKRLELNARARAKRLGYHGSREHFDHLVEYVRRQIKRPVTEEAVRSMFDCRSPEHRIEAGLHALKLGEAAAAVELIRPAVDELEAALPHSQSERRA